ncbi:hypothetical protein [Planktothrix agardhii]|uniref:hypothetical protein n=1 Tax=Planktothrix agardhii TaxID=1160 RepID=UPI001D0A6E87|nr:hypothetical protein [Planktothrix agardhii]MCB8781147.1 hypothetical protein [Planktothrix agardhii 1808]
MLIKFEEVCQDIDTLPEEAQLLILDFIQLLKKRYPSTELENKIRENDVLSTLSPKPHPLDTFIEKYGAWEDELTAEEIVKEIYDSRTVSNYDIAILNRETARSITPDPYPPNPPCTGGLGGLFRCSLLIRDFKHNSNRIAILVYELFIRYRHLHLLDEKY